LGDEKSLPKSNNRERTLPTGKKGGRKRRGVEKKKEFPWGGSEKLLERTYQGRTEGKKGEKRFHREKSAAT